MWIAGVVRLEMVVTGYTLDMHDMRYADMICMIDATVEYGKYPYRAQNAYIAHVNYVMHYVANNFFKYNKK